MNRDKRTPLVARGEATEQLDPEAAARSFFSSSLGLSIGSSLEPERYSDAHVEVEDFLSRLLGTPGDEAE